MLRCTSILAVSLRLSQTQLTNSPRHYQHQPFLIQRSHRPCNLHLDRALGLKPAPAGTIVGFQQPEPLLLARKQYQKVIMTRVCELSMIILETPIPLEHHTDRIIRNTHHNGADNHSSISRNRRSLLWSQLRCRRKSKHLYHINCEGSNNLAQLECPWTRSCICRSLSSLN